MSDFCGYWSLHLSQSDCGSSSEDSVNDIGMLEIDSTDVHPLVTFYPVGGGSSSSYATVTGSDTIYFSIQYNFLTYSFEGKLVSGAGFPCRQDVSACMQGKFTINSIAEKGTMQRDSDPDEWVGNRPPVT